MSIHCTPFCCYGYTYVSCPFVHIISYSQWQIKKFAARSCVFIQKEEQDFACSILFTNPFSSPFATFGNILNFSRKLQNIYFTHFSSKIKYALSEYGIINIPNYEVSFLEITLTFAGFERGEGYVSGCYGKASEMFPADLLPL